MKSRNINNKVIIVLASTLILFIVGVYLLFKLSPNTYSNNYQNQRGAALQQGVNKENCLADECLAVADFDYPAGTLSAEAREALIEALNDEYKAYALYEKTIDKLGFVAPFSMIIRAEEQHISSLKALFDKYSIEIPENDWLGKVTAASSLKQACQNGVDAEIANANLYKDKLLPVVGEYTDIQAVFTNLMNASLQKHLPAFERCN